MSGKNNANKDRNLKYINNVGKDILNLKGKLMVHHSQNCLNRDDIEDQQESRAIVMMQDHQSQDHSKQTKLHEAWVFKVCFKIL